MTSHPIQIRLLGAMRLSLSNGSVLDEFGPQSGALLARLALEPQRAFTRYELIDFLWPEDEPEEGRRKLRQLVYGIRRQLEQAGYSGDSFFLSTRDSLQVNAAAVDVDTRRFECMVCRADHSESPEVSAKLYSQAVDLYRGDLLPGFYQDEFLSERRRLADKCFGALRSLSQAHEALGRLEQAVTAARRAVDLNSTGEEAHRDLMRLYALTGKPSAVLRQYEELERALRDELDVEPAPATRELLATLRDTDKIPPAAPRPTAQATSLPATEVRAAHSLPSRERRLAWMLAAPFVLVSVLVLLWVSLGAGLRARKAPGPQTRSAAAVTARPYTLWDWRYHPAAGDHDSEPTAIAADYAGNVYVCGFLQTAHNDVDFLLIKLDPNGRKLWERRYNGPGNDVDRARSLDIDKQGNILVTGDSYGKSGSGHEHLSELDYATVKFSPGGEKLWVRRYNGPANGKDWPIKVAVDPAGEVYVTGRSWGGASADFDIVTIKYATDGTPLWTKPWGLPGRADAATDMAVDSAGRVYIAGTSGGHGAIPARNLLLCYDPDGKVAWAKLRARSATAGEAPESPRVACGPGRQSWLLSDEPAANGPGSVAHLQLYDDAGREVKDTTFQGAAGSLAHPLHLGVDASGRAYVAVEYRYPVPNRPPESFVACFDPVRGLLWSHNTTLEGAGVTVLSAATGSAGHVIVGGVRWRPVASSGLSEADAVALRYAPDGTPTWSASYNAPTGGMAGISAVALAGAVLVTGQSNAAGTRDIFVVKYSHWPSR